MKTISRTVKIKTNYEIVAWKWMRYSAIILIPLVWVHVLIQDILVGPHNITLDYVVRRWSMIGWQIYDILLLSFAFAHGMNGLRQIMVDHIHSRRARMRIGRLIFLVWVLITFIGGFAIVGAAHKHLAVLN
jgi:succinate dehydrogenase / fumarate reductase membrane anchor subunit